MKRRMLVFRNPTHEGQALPADFESAIASFQQEVAAVVAKKHVTSDRLINMNETPVYFAPSIPHVIAKKGSKSVPVDMPKTKIIG